MKTITAFLAGFGIVGILAVFALSFFMIAMAVYGVYLAFCASVVLGIIVLFVQPSPTIIGLVMFFFNKNIAQMIVDFLNQ